jgi:CheY-like chemotaxis protein
MSRTARIMVVDDSATARDIFATYLRHAGFDVTEAPDGPTALANLESEPPDVIVLDLLLPGMDGFEIMSRVRARPETQELPVICVTAAMSDEYRARAADLGCVAFLEKPDSPRHIADTVRAILADSGADSEVDPDVDPGAEAEPSARPTD